MSIAIRDAGGEDVGAIDALLRGAFPAEEEAMLVARLCMDGDMVLVLVARDEGDGAVAGMIGFSRMAVRVDGRDVSAVALAPVAVEPAYRGQGVADALIRAGLERMEREGVVLCFVLGEPALYARFGFDPALALHYDTPYAGPYLMAAALQGGLVPCGRRESARHAPAFAALGATR